jgi:hypothetical protein
MNKTVLGEFADVPLRSRAQGPVDCDLHLHEEFHEYHAVLGT